MIRIRRTPIARLVVAALVAVPAVAFALHRQTPFMVAMSKLPGGHSERPFAQGEVAGWIAFESTSDLLGTGLNGREIFLFDNNPPRALHQVTNFPTGDSGNPSATGNGQTVAFDSTSDILHRGITARQIFLWDRGSGAFSQLTNGNADSRRPKIDPDGNSVAFESDANLKNIPTATGTNIYVWTNRKVCDLYGCSSFTPVTSHPGTSRNANYSGDSRYLVFESNAPLLGNANGHFQIFVHERSTGRRFQLTNGDDDSINATTDLHGRLVVFQSRADLLHNGSRGWQLFLVDRQLGQLRQLTHTPFGDNTAPSIGSGGRFISFVSSGDPIGTGPAGQHLYLFDLIENQIYQITRGTSGFSDHPSSTADTIFFFDSSEDPMGLGLTGQQVYILNVFQAVPGRSLGPQSFTLAPGTPEGGGSSVRIVTRDHDYTAPIARGSIDFTVTGRNYDGEAGILVPAGGIKLPAVPVPGVGAVCFKAIGDGLGALDCDGGRGALDVSTLQDHDLDAAEDPRCLLGCRENDPSCAGPFSPVHVRACPSCTAGVCSVGVNGGLACSTNDACPGGECQRTCTGGVAAGEACLTDAECDPLQQCADGQLGVCNGPAVTQLSGTFGAGAMQLDVPLEASISVNLGRDGVYCTADDTIVVSGIKTDMRLTTGLVEAGVLDADDASGAYVAGAELGSPFSCDQLEVKDVSGARLVGAATFLDVPFIPKLHDAVLTWRFAADPGPPCLVNCPQPCTMDTDCNDGNLCNGTETCVAGSCRPGTPVICSDGNACNGVETCEPASGACGPGVAPSCDDQNACTDDSCDLRFGCLHAPNTNPCSDGSLCTTGDVCQDGECRGTAIECNDGDFCNGLETCDPGTGTCTSNPPPTCDDADLCTTDSCDSATGCHHDPTPAAIVCAAGDGNVCNGPEACDPATGACVSGPAPSCDDANACTQDLCDPVTGCSHAATPAALLCNAGDGDICDGVEACDPGTGACVPTPVSCDDHNPCTADSCDAVLGCLHVPNLAASCDDGNACTANDSCATGVCTGVATSCDDGDACNGQETCDPGTGTCLAGTPPDCADDLACTTDTCDPVGGCRNDAPAGIAGILCQLSALRAAIQSAVVGTIQGQKLPRLLDRMVAKAQRKVDLAQDAGTARRAELLRAANRRVAKFIRIVANAGAHDRIQPAMTDELLGLARGVRGGVQGELARSR